MRSFQLRSLLLSTLLPLAVSACANAGDETGDGIDDEFADGKADGAVASGSPEALAVLALVNDLAVTAEELDDDARLYRTAAYNIIEHRDGDDGVPGTADDNPFDDLDELDRVSYVGPVALNALLDYAIANGYMPTAGDKQLDVVFSPQPYANSHNVRVAGLIDGAEHSLDIAMYSYSDARISTAIESAVDRGVKVRFIFDTAYADRSLTGSSFENSSSARLERQGVNVRYVNKIMHHKFVIVDGPRDDEARAATARIATGSGNWSNGAATRYDENTLFLTGYPEMALRMQREFNRMWDHSRDFVYDASLPYESSTFAISDADVVAADDATTDAVFTSSNFSVSGTTFRITGANTVSDRYVAAIMGATESIEVASGHLRSRPIAEALIAKHEADPSVDIRVYLDGQEYLSEWYHNDQLDDLEDCLADASTESQRRNCLDKGFLFAYQVHQAGIDVRFKYYSYRWHYSYAKQMHHKYMIIDGDEVLTGSYNYSDNAEHNTFENVLILEGAELQPLVAAFSANFDGMWDTGRAEGLLAELEDEVATASQIPLVFDAMALTWDEVTALKGLIRDNCSAINTEPYRLHPEDHWTCAR
jgi:phosphatidylserine/phosphatidylglycerophosphate/cardiolipin synthase-like enzyme